MRQRKAKEATVGTWKLPAGIESACGLFKHIFSWLNTRDIVRF
jgi:hypothetical protein